MKGLSEILKKDKEFEKLVSALDAGASPAVMSGIAPIHRAHLAAALNSALDVPVFVICANEMEAGKMGTDLAAFSGCQVPVLTGREFTFYNAEGVSRQLEHKRIGALYQLATGQCEFGAATVDGLMQACIPKEVLLKSAINIKTGDSYDLDALCERLVGAGYTRCEQVEGVGQFARRGGILDVFSAAYDSPVRIEFWGDEVDAMGLFDVATQRRSENIFEAEILPGAETLPEFYPGGGEALAAKLRADIAALAGKKTTNRELLKNMEADAVRLENHLTLYNGDKYISIIYGGKRSAIEYIPQNALILLSEPAKLKERTKNYVWQLTEDVDALKSSGVVQSVPEDYFTPWSDVCDRLKDFPVIMADSFLGSDYPMTPKQLLNMQTKQLPSYGGSFDTAAGDIGHYLRSGFGVAVLCLSEEKARRLEENLRGLGFPVYLDFELENTPQSGKCAVGMHI